MEGLVTLTELKTLATMDDVAKIVSAYNLKKYEEAEAQRKANAGGKS